MVFGQDANFADEALLTRYNADLANDLGNLVSRVTTLIHRSCGGVVPAPDASLQSRPPEAALQQGAETLVASVSAAIQTFQLSAALRDIWDYIGAVNRYIVQREPWKLAKASEHRADLETTLYTSAEALRIIAELLRPFMPDSAGRTLGMLGVTVRKDAWSGLRWGQLTAGTRLTETQPLFPRIEQTVEELRKMADEQAPSTTAPGTVAPSAAPSTAAPAP